MLIAIQYVFSAVKGVELVTAFLFAFCFCFGSVCGVIVAVAFILLRIMIFGFFPTVFILYLSYYPLFAVVAGAMGRALKKSSPIKQVVLCFLVAVVMTILFTALDDLITPLFFSYDQIAWKAYVIQSLPTCLIQCVCVTLTMALLFLPLKKTFGYFISKT